MKIEEALIVIQDECNSHAKCQDCPLYYNGCKLFCVLLNRVIYKIDLSEIKEE